MAMRGTTLRFWSESVSYRLDLHAGVLWRGEERLKVPPKEWKALCHLVQNAGKLIEKHELVEVVWGATAGDGGVGKVIGSLRSILGDDKQQPRFIETHHARGYRFIGRTDDAPFDRTSPTHESLSSSGAPLIEVASRADVERFDQKYIAIAKSQRDRAMPGKRSEIADKLKIDVLRDDVFPEDIYPSTRSARLRNRLRDAWSSFILRFRRNNWRR